MHILETLEIFLKTLGFIYQYTTPSSLPLDNKVYKLLAGELATSELSKFLLGFPIGMAFHPDAKPEVAGVLFFTVESNEFIILSRKNSGLKLVQVRFTHLSKHIFAEGRDLQTKEGFVDLLNLLERLIEFQFLPVVVKTLGEKGFGGFAREK